MDDSSQENPVIDPSSFVDDDHHHTTVISNNRVHTTRQDVDNIIVMDGDDDDDKKNTLKYRQSYSSSLTSGDQPTTGSPIVTHNSNNNDNQPHTGGDDNGPTTTTTSTLFRQPIYMVIAYSIFNISMAMSMSFIMAVLMPKQVIEMVGDEDKASKLGIIVMYAAVLFSIAGPVTGFISDHVTQKSRLPFVVMGTLVWIVSIMVRPLIVSWYVMIDVSDKSKRNQMFLLYTLVSALGKMFYAVGTTPFIALLPDFFPREQYNSISAVVGCSNLTGAVIGVVVMGMIYDRMKPIWLCTIVCSILLLSMVSLIPFRRSNNLDHRLKQSEEKSLLREEDHGQSDEDEHSLWEEQPEFEYLPVDQLGTSHTGIVDTSTFFVSSFTRPFRSWNFTWVFITRFIMTLGNSSIKSFFLFFIRDTMKIAGAYKLLKWNGFPRTDEQAQSLFMGVAFIFSVISSLSSSKLADLVGRRMLVFISGILCAFSAAVMIGSLDYNIFLLCGVLMGLGVGAYISVDLALVNAVLPSEKERAKDLALWNISQNLPDLIASPLFGVIIDKGNQMSKGFGYVLQYIICITLFVLTSCLIWCVDLPDDHGTLRLTKRKQWHENEAFVALTDSESEGEDEPTITSPARNDSPTVQSDESKDLLKFEDQ